MTKREYDLIVVGAGPAGSSAAYAAAKNGIKVALLEKEENVAQTVRTSGVTWIDYAKEFGIPEDCYNPIRTYNFCSPNNTVSITDNKNFSPILFCHICQKPVGLSYVQNRSLWFVISDGYCIVW